MFRLGQLSTLAGFFLASVGEAALSGGTMTCGVYNDHVGFGTGMLSSSCQPLSPAPIDAAAAGMCFLDDWVVGPIRAEAQVGVMELPTYDDLKRRAGILTEAAAEAGEISNLVYVYEDPAEDRPLLFIQAKFEGLRFQLPACFLGGGKTFLAGDRASIWSIDGHLLVRLCMGADWAPNTPGMGHAFEQLFDAINIRPNQRQPDWMVGRVVPAYPGFLLATKTQLVRRAMGVEREPDKPGMCLAYDIILDRTMDTAVKGHNSQVSALPGPIDPSKSIAWGRGLEEVTPGEPASFTVQIPDESGNNRTADEAHPSILVVGSATQSDPLGASAINASLSLIESGQYEVTYYTPTHADTLEVAIVMEPFAIERQEVALTLTSATAGSGFYTLGLEHLHRTAPIPVYAVSDTVADALSAVAGIGKVNVSRSVTNTGLSGVEVRWTYAVDFSSTLGDVSQLTVDADAMAGLSCVPVVSTIVEGHADHIIGSPFRPVVLPGPASAEGSSNVGQRAVLGRAGLWRVTLPVVALIFHLIAFLYVATKPLRYGDHGVAAAETIPYWKRFLAVSTLYLLSGGAPIAFLIIEGYLLSWVWRSWGTSWGFVLVAFFASFTYVVMRPLPYRRPDPKVLRHPLFALWREYFGLEHVVQDRDVLARLVADRSNTFLLAQLPHGIMPFGAIFGNSIADQVFAGMSPVSGVVATMLLRTPVMRHLINWLGVREAGRASIVRMFADGYRGVGVVTGGIAEMFVSQETEDIIAMRKGFAKIALQGGHVVLPVFVFGVSRTHVLAPGIKKLQSLSRRLRVPLVMFHGAFSLVPYRQKLKLVVGRAVLVKKVDEPTEDQINDVIREIHERIEDIYNDASIKPAWETRPLRFSN